MVQGSHSSGNCNDWTVEIEKLAGKYEVCMIAIVDALPSSYLKLFEQLLGNKTWYNKDYVSLFKLRYSKVSECV